MIVNEVIEYPVVSKGGAVLGYASNLYDAEAVFSHHYPMTEIPEFSQGARLPERHQAHGFTFAIGWVEKP